MNTRTRPHFRSAALLLIGALACLCILAAGSDSGVRITGVKIQSDRVELNEQGELIYSGNVRITHPNFTLQAERLSAEIRNGELSRFVAEGSPVSMSQRVPEAGNASVRGSAKSMIYDHIRRDLLFEGEARFERTDGSRFESDHLLYNAKTREISSESPAQMQFPRRRD
ncbi:MAG: hypothetical protein ISN29_02330 [Gammaproteobacteria bacterium AqS3]|nr:hypothetical protein [Gammaproteobacteria bacterium AqS3]